MFCGSSASFRNFRLRIYPPLLAVSFQELHLDDLVQQASHQAIDRQLTDHARKDRCRGHAEDEMGKDRGQDAAKQAKEWSYRKTGNKHRNVHGQKDAAGIGDHVESLRQYDTDRDK